MNSFLGKKCFAAKTTTTATENNRQMVYYTLLTSSSCHPILGDKKIQNIVYQQVIKYIFFE